MSEMHKQNIFNDERCGNVDDVGEDEWVNEQFDRIWKELEAKDKKDKKDKCWLDVVLRVEGRLYLYEIFGLWRISFFFAQGVEITFGLNHCRVRIRNARL